MKKRSVGRPEDEDASNEAMMYWRFARKAAQAWPYGDALSPSEIELLDRVLLADEMVDLGCGVGRAFSYIEQRGSPGVAVDILDEMLSMARIRRGPQVEMVKADIRRLSRVFRGDSFRNAICIGNTVSGLLSREDLCRFVGGVVDILKCPGVLVLDFISAEQVRMGVSGVSITEDPGSSGSGVGAVFRQTLGDGSVAEGYQYYWDAAEVVSLGKDHGFHVELTKLSADIPRMVAVCSKVSA